MARVLIIQAILVVGLTLFVSGAAARDGGGVVYVESDGARGALSQERVEKCVRLLMQEMHLDLTRLPRIVVVHVTRQEGERAGLHNVVAKVWANVDEQNERSYELWLIGDVTTHDYAFSLHSLLEQHFALHDTDAEQRGAVARVVRYLEATVSAKR